MGDTSTAKDVIAAVAETIAPHWPRLNRERDMLLRRRHQLGLAPPRATQLRRLQWLADVYADAVEGEPLERVTEQEDDP